MSGLLQAAGFRHGIVDPPREVPGTFAEPPGVVNVAVPERGANGWRSAAGGIARDRRTALERALGEALERYAAHVCVLPRRSRSELAGAETLDLEDFSLWSNEQRAQPEFPRASLYGLERGYTNVFSADDNREVWVPHELVGLSAAGVATSSGLAAGPTALDAVLRGLQELVERDALMCTWLHGVAGCRVELPTRIRTEVEALGGSVACIDATPAYSPHPVALVAGTLPLRGRARISLGAACRATWRDAVEKAYLEFLQGVVFVAHYRAAHPELAFESPRDVESFDEHAVYYSLRPDEWASVPLLRGHSSAPPADGDPSLASLIQMLHREGVRVYYRELSTVDVLQAGVHVVRVVSPELAPIHCDEAWPFLGGTVPDVEWRYPWVDVDELSFPSRYPHPLG